MPDDPTDCPAIGRVIPGRLENYCILTKLECCLYGHVMAGIGLYTGDCVAIKSLKRDSIEKSDVAAGNPETPLAEVFFAPLWRSCQGVSVIREVVACEDYHFVVSEYANGQDLLEVLKKHPYGVDERIAAIVIQKAAESLYSCHRQGIALQDFSLENCLLSYDIDGEYQIKLCDPGQAILFETGQDGKEKSVPYSGCVGKKFRPPEIFEERPYYATRTDSWCLGWATWYFLFAVAIFESVHPYDNDPNWRLFCEGDHDGLFASCGIDPATVSAEAKDFMFRLLHPQPLQRMSVEQALQHPFLKRAAGSGLTYKDLAVEINDAMDSSHLALQCLSLAAENDRPALLRALSYHVRPLARAMSNDFHRPLVEVKARSRTIRRLLMESGPCIPRSYFNHYLYLLCSPSKPSGTLLTYYNQLRNHAQSDGGRFTTRPESPSVLVALRRENSTVGSTSRTSRLSPRGFSAYPLSRLSNGNPLSSFRSSASFVARGKASQTAADLEENKRLDEPRSTSARDHTPTLESSKDGGGLFSIPSSSASRLRQEVDSVPSLPSVVRTSDSYLIQAIGKQPARKNHREGSHSATRPLASFAASKTPETVTVSHVNLDKILSHRKHSREARSSHSQVSDGSPFGKVLGGGIVTPKPAEGPGVGACFATPPSVPLSSSSTGGNGTSRGFLRLHGPVANNNRNSETNVNSNTIPSLRRFKMADVPGVRTPKLNNNTSGHISHTGSIKTVRTSAGGASTACSQRPSQFDQEGFIPVRSDNHHLSDLQMPTASDLFQNPVFTGAITGAHSSPGRTRRMLQIPLTSTTASLQGTASVISNPPSRLMPRGGDKVSKFASGTPSPGVGYVNGGVVTGSIPMHYMAPRDAVSRSGQRC